ncbi:MAG: hypothetical protein JNK15_04965 [Planctomycetes bacterium]|nr:hypothetical protein [Planctomycetota bacterium]
MSDPNHKPGVIRRDAVRMATQPALVDCGSTEQGHAARPITVVPLLDGDRIAGFEVRCGCGAVAVVECVYGKEN